MGLVTKPATRILSLDSGSSSLKFATFNVTADEEVQQAEGAFEGIGSPSPSFWTKRRSGEKLESEATEVDPLLDTLAYLLEEKLDFEMVVHRVVFGGADRKSVERVEDRLISELRALQTFDPLHIPMQLRSIEVVRKKYPGMPQYLCFDTAFHASMPEIAKRLPVPRSLHDEGVRRFGYHGLSYASILSQLDSATIQGRVLVAHLGSGCSMAAVRSGTPIDTTMGFSTLGGLMMATRPGDIDPGVILHLLRDDCYSIESLEHLLESECGLRGVSGVTEDMRKLLSLGTAEAAEAVALFAYLAAKAAGSLVVTMGGLDTLVFTGGIGERSAAIRKQICDYLACFGVKIDEKLNSADAMDISAGMGKRILVLPSKETRMMARLAFDAQNRVALSI